MLAPDYFHHPPSFDTDERTFETDIEAEEDKELRDLARQDVEDVVQKIEQLNKDLILLQQQLKKLMSLRSKANFLGKSFGGNQQRLFLGLESSHNLLKLKLVKLQLLFFMKSRWKVL